MPIARTNHPQDALRNNQTGTQPDPTRRAPIDAFLLWGVVSAAIFLIAGGIAIYSVAEATYTEDLARGIVAALFSAAGFVGIILARIGTAINRK